MLRQVQAYYGWVPGADGKRPVGSGEDFNATSPFGLGWPQDLRKVTSSPLRLLSWGENRRAKFGYYSVADMCKTWDMDLVKIAISALNYHVLGKLFHGAKMP